MTPQETWQSQCDAARGILDDFGTEKALGYLVGEKLLNFLEVAEREPNWRAEIPAFIAEIKDIFEPWQLREFFDTPHRLGALGHTADEAGHRLGQHRGWPHRPHTCCTSSPAPNAVKDSTAGNWGFHISWKTK